MQFTTVEACASALQLLAKSFRFLAIGDALFRCFVQQALPWLNASVTIDVCLPDSPSVCLPACLSACLPVCTTTLICTVLNVQAERRLLSRR